jgi:inorganic phosphate transporter, PiT family
VAIFWIFQRMPSTHANRTFRIGQLFSGTFMAYTHGANDAQKTMGVIALALLANGSIDSFYIPNWVKITAGLAIAAGTYAGGWRIMRTIGQRCTRSSRRAGSRRRRPRGQ